MRTALLFLCIPAILNALSSAQTPIGPFVGTDSDGFETQTAFSTDPCVIERVFSDQADLCTPAGSFATFDTALTDICTVGPDTGAVFYSTQEGLTEITFDTPVSRFGAMFATNGGDPGIRGLFYDCDGAFIGFISEPLPSADCNWYWRGWAAPVGQEFGRIELFSNDNDSFQGNLQIDGMEADFDSVCGGPPGTKRCFGDGVDNVCPCGNNNNGLGPRDNEAGCANSAFPTGCNLEGTGSSSLAAADLQLCFVDAVPGQPGLIFAGTTAISIPFGDGIRCCGGNVLRLEILFADAAGTGCSTVDIGAATGALAGETWCYQYWYRDPLGPCLSGFNLSNAYTVLWTP